MREEGNRRAENAINIYRTDKQGGLYCLLTLLCTGSTSLIPLSPGGQCAPGVQQGREVIGWRQPGHFSTALLSCTLLFLSSSPQGWTEQHTGETLSSSGPDLQRPCVWVCVWKVTPVLPWAPLLGNHLKHTPLHAHIHSLSFCSPSPSWVHLAYLMPDSLPLSLIRVCVHLRVFAVCVCGAGNWTATTSAASKMELSERCAILRFCK